MGQDLVEQLATAHTLPTAELETLLTTQDAKLLADLQAAAQIVRKQVFGTAVYLRGLIELSNFCRRDCYYCGIRRSNRALVRERLSPEAVLDCCKAGYANGFRTVVLQGGEDAFWTDARLTRLLAQIRTACPDCAITLSLGERSAESYRLLRQAGAERYLLRHETANAAHYALLHPPEQSHAVRMDCLRQLRQLGYQTGCGMMIGSPHQTTAHLVEDLRFLERFQPEMVGIGPFLPQHETPFAQEPAGSADLTLRMLSIIRLMLPNVLLPATTALGTLLPDGLERGILAGANVIMQNITPPSMREHYTLYDGKTTAAHDTVAWLAARRASVASIGYELVHQRGDAPKFASGASDAACV